MMVLHQGLLICGMQNGLIKIWKPEDADVHVSSLLLGRHGIQIPKLFLKLKLVPGLQSFSEKVMIISYGTLQKGLVS